MTRRTLQTLLLLATTAALAGCNSGVATQTDLVDTESGAGVAGSGTFKATGSWDLKLSYDCTRQLAEKVPGAASGIQLTVYNGDDQSEAFEHPESHWKGAHGNQVLHFKRSGPYSVAVDSKCDWRLVVIDTSGKS
jgi:hypothetical protein